MRKILAISFSAVFISAILLFWPLHKYEQSFIYKAKLIHQAKNNNWENADKIIVYINDKTSSEKSVIKFIELLRNYPNNNKWPAIINATKHKSPLVKEAALKALISFPTPEAKVAILNCSKSSNKNVRIQAANTIQQWPQKTLSPDELAEIKALMKEYETYMISQPKNWQIQLDLGNYYAQNKEYSKAIKAYKRSININNSNVASLANLGKVHLSLKEYDNAKKYTIQALEIDENNLSALNTYASFLLETKEYNKADSLYRKIFRLYPTSANAAYNIAILNSKEDILEAEKWANIASNLVPENSNYKYSYAYFLIKNKKPRLAVNILIDLIEDNPYYVDAYLLLAQLYHENNETESAVILLNRSLRIPKINPQVKDRINRLINEIKV